MHKVYNYIDSHGIPEGVVEIDSVSYKFTRVYDLRYSERPDYKGWTNPYLGTWIICPKEETYLRVELI